MAARYRKYANNPQVYRNADNYGFSSWEELLRDSGGKPDIEELPNISAYKFDDSPSVYRADDNYEFGSSEEFLRAGGNFGLVETRKRPDRNQQLAEQAARLGMSPKDLAELYQMQNAPTADEKAKIRGDLGIPGLEESVFEAPSQSLTELYNAAYGAAGLSEFREKMKALDKTIAERRGQYATAAGTINENPWLSEASRTGRLSTLGDKAQMDIDNILGEFGSYERLYNEGLNEVNRVVGFQKSDMDEDEQRRTRKLNYLLAKAQEQEQTLGQRGNELLARYLPDFLNSAEGALAAASSAKAPETITTDAGVFAWNPGTRSFEMVIGPGETTGDQSWMFEPLSPSEAEKLGVPYGTLAGEAAQMGVTPQKEASQEQQKAAGFGNRVKDAIDVFKNTFKLFEPGGVYSGLAGQANWKIDWAAPNSKAPSYLQAHKQAAETFINAILRRESGAAVTPEEYKRYESQYIPKAGDKPEVINQKKAAMNRVLEGLANEAGPAWSTGAKPPAGNLFEQFEASKTSAKAPSASRTDRHLNPTAFTTDVAKTAGLKLGVDYVVGDPFPNNPKLHTAKLLKDPVETTIRVLDNIGFYTSAGKQRWSHTAIRPAQWNAMSKQQKVAVVDDMYKKENGPKSSITNFYA